MARAKAPDELAVLAVSALIARGRDDGDGSTSMLRELAARVDRQPALAASSAAWLAAKEALQHPETRDIGLSLAVAVARANEKAAGRLRDAAAIDELAAEFAARNGPEPVARLFADRKDDVVTLMRLAIALARANRREEASLRLDHAWKTSQADVLAHFNPLAPLCVDAGLGADLARGLRDVKEPNLQNGYVYGITRAFLNHSTAADDRIRDVIAIHEAVADTFGAGYRESVYHALATYLIRMKRPKFALEARRRQVLPPEGNAAHLTFGATSLADLAGEVGVLDKLEADCREALEKDSKWGAGANC